MRWDDLARLNSVIGWMYGRMDGWMVGCMDRYLKVSCDWLPFGSEPAAPPSYTSAQDHEVYRKCIFSHPQLLVHDLLPVTCTHLLWQVDEWHYSSLCSCLSRFTLCVNQLCVCVSVCMVQVLLMLWGHVGPCLHSHIMGTRLHHEDKKQVTITRYHWTCNVKTCF